MESCRICNRIFTTNKLLKRHVNEVHSGTKFNCICGKSFSRKNRLMNHENICSVFKTSNNLKEENVVETQSIDSKIKFLNDIVKNKSPLYNNLTDSNESRDGNVIDDDGDEADVEGYNGIISKPCVKRYRSRNSKMFNDSTDEEDVSKPPEKRLRISHKSQNGSGDDSDRSGYNRKGDIFSQNNSMGTDSEESNSDESDDHSEGGNDSEENSSDESDSDKICYCRDCNSSKKSKIKHVHSKKRKFNDRSEWDIFSKNNSMESDESDSYKICYCRNCNSSKKSKIKHDHLKNRKFNDQSEGDSDSEGESDSENNSMEIDEGSNPYSRYYKSQASGGGVFKTIIGNQTSNIGGRFSYLSNTRFPTGRIGNDFMKPVSSYLSY